MKAKGKKCYGVKGYAGKPNIPLLYKKTIVEIKEEHGGKDVVVDRTVIHILGVDSGKADIMKRLAIEEPGAGYCHFPAGDIRGYDNAYFKGLTSERQIDKKVNGTIKKVWKKKSGARNEPLDLFNYNYAVLEILRPEWDVLEEKLRRGINYMKKSKKRNVSRRSINGIEV